MRVLNRYSTFDIIMTKTGSTEYHKNGFAGFQQCGWKYSLVVGVLGMAPACLPACLQRPKKIMPLRWEYIYITSILATILLFLSFIHCKNSLLTPTYSSVNFFYVKIMKYMTLRYIELHRTNRTIILNITETKKQQQ